MADGGGGGSGGAAGRFVFRAVEDEDEGAGASRYAVWVPAPAESAAESPAGDGRRLPVVLFLHGAGERGTDGVAPTTVGIGPVLRGQAEPVNPVAGRSPEMTAGDLPPSPAALVVLPQARPGRDWTSPDSVRTALAALDATIAEFGADPARQSLTGVSMGGSGAWHLALREQGRFTALAPVCGWLARESAPRGSADPYAAAARALRDLPVWVFHGAADRIIPVEASRGMVAALRSAGADVRYTEYPDVGHASWRQAYAEPALLPWLLLGRRLPGPASSS